MVDLNRSLWQKDYLFLESYHGAGCTAGYAISGSNGTRRAIIVVTPRLPLQNDDDIIIYMIPCSKICIPYAVLRTDH